MTKQEFMLFLLVGLAAREVFAAPRTVTLDVRNMTCPVCPIAVKKALERVPGVHKVTVDLAGQTASVEFDDALATAARLADATREAGYPSSARENRP